MQDIVHYGNVSHCNRKKDCGQPILHRVGATASLVLKCCAICRHGAAPTYIFVYTIILVEKSAGIIIVDVKLNYNDVRMEGRNMSTIKDEEALYQNLKNLL